MARDTFTTAIDFVTDNSAALRVELTDALDKIERAAPFAGFLLSTTATGDITLTDASDPVQSVNCNGADRIITLPAVGSSNGAFFIMNRTAATYVITVKNAGGTTIATVAVGGAVVVLSDSTAWYSVGVTLSGTETLSNKRITRRVVVITNSATPAINTDNLDVATLLALNAAITSMSTNLTGTPTDGQRLEIHIRDDGTARALAWGASFGNRGCALPTTTVISKHLIIYLEYDASSLPAPIWGCVGIAQEA